MRKLSLEKALICAEELAEDVVGPAAATVDREGTWPEDGVRALCGELGGLVVAEEHGGSGHGMGALVRVGEIIGRRCASTALCFGMHCVASAVIGARATPTQAVRYLEPIAAGEHLTTLALSEPGTGSQFWMSESTLARTEHGYRVDGRKTFVTNGGHADSYVLSTVAAEVDAPVGDFSCVVIDADSSGLVWGTPWTGMGMRGNSSLALTLDGVETPSEALIGAEGEQIWYVFHVVAPYFLAAMSGTYLGIAAAAFEEARLHLSERRYTHGGTPPAQQPVVQHRIGELWATIERTRRLLHHAADEGDAEGPEALVALCSAKAEVAAAATTVVNEAMTLVGGIGYREGGALERHLRDVRAAHVMSPTTDVLRTWVGRAVLGENLLAE
jgi:alkylation response protein AidB-like acyl-CoA dehydrogenase